MRGFCFHNWTKWSQLISTYSHVKQFRYCTKCNQESSRKSRIHNQSIDYNLNSWNVPESNADKLEKGKNK